MKTLKGQEDQGDRSKEIYRFFPKFPENTIAGDARSDGVKGE